MGVSTKQAPAANLDIDPIDSEDTWSNKATPLATIILPAFNEALALPVVLQELSSIITDQYQVIVVDDGSTDGTAAVAQRYPCEVLQHPANYGKGIAVRTGIRHARGDKVIIMDADATYPASAIPKLVALLDKCDLVRCIRLAGLECMPLTNRVGNWIFDRLLVNVLGLEGLDQFSGLYGIRRDRLIQMNLEAERFDLEAEINMKAKAFRLRIATLPIVYQSRLGDKKLRPFRDGCQILLRILLINLLHNPISIFILPGIFAVVLGILGAAQLNRLSMFATSSGSNISGIFLASLSVLFGFYLVTIGLAAAFYSFEAGQRLRPWLVWISSVHVRLGAAALGISLSAWGFVQLTLLVNNWRILSSAAFIHSPSLLLSVILLIGGMQLISAALFVSIFASRFRRTVLDLNEQQFSLIQDSSSTDLNHRS